MKRLSIVINGFGHVDWWKACLRSVLQVSVEGVEILCVDDASGDRETERFLRELSSRDDRIVPVLRTSNGGVCVSRNEALDLAQGERVAFVDYDDTVDASVYGKALAFLDDHPDCDVCAFGVHRHWIDIGLELVDAFDDDFVIRGRGRALFDAVNERMASRNLLNYVWNKVYRRSFLESNRIRFEPHSVCYEDIIFNLDCLMKGAVFGGIREVGYTWTHRSCGSTLGRYRPWIEEGAALYVERSRRWFAHCGLPQDEIDARIASLERSRADAMIVNMYRPNSGFGMRRRIRAIRELRKTAAFRAVLLDVRNSVFWFLRKHLYVAPVRRWHIRRLYPYVRRVER